MARELISIKGVNGDILKGYSWKIDNPIGVFFIVTGMEEHALRYDKFAGFLNSNGYSVFCIDHYGQGENAENESKLGVVPRSAFSKYVRILDDLVRKNQIKGKKTILLGHSMGSFIVQDYIQRYSTRVTKAIIMGSNGNNAKTAYKFGYPIARMICKFTGDEKKGKFLRGLVIGKFAKSVKNRKTDSDWLSYNEENVQNYIADPKCGKGSSNGFYRELLKGNHRLYKSKFLKKISPNIEILISAGEEDPVGAFGKGPRRLEEMYKKLGVKNVELKLYKHMRHEVLNETCKEVVHNDIIDFINK